MKGEVEAEMVRYRSLQEGKNNKLVLILQYILF
jgi:hypothetical protein